MIFVIFGKDGTAKGMTEQIDVTENFMGRNQLIAIIETPVKIPFAPGDWIDYYGQIYTADMEPTISQTAYNKFSYQLSMYDYTLELERCSMRDLVPYDKGVVYPTPLLIEFTGKVSYLTERIKACLDAMYGDNSWTFRISIMGEQEEKSVSIQNASCWSALALINTVYNLKFTINNRKIKIYDDELFVLPTPSFAYGQGRGLYGLDRTADTDTGVVTKLRVYGGERNLTYSYPKQPDYTGSVLPPNYALSPLRLMLPDFKKDGVSDFLLASDEAIAEYGIREAVVTYDDIYPTIEDVTNPNSRLKIDEILTVWTPAYENSSTFMVETKAMGFKDSSGSVLDFGKLLTNEEPQLVFKTGALQGYGFKIVGYESMLYVYMVNGVQVKDAGYKLILERGKLSSDSDASDFYVPTAEWNATSGDKFVLIGIKMPMNYVLEAEKRLKKRGLEYLDKYSKTNYSYSLDVSEGYMNGIDVSKIKPGKYMPVIFEKEELIIIQSITKKYSGKSPLPSYQITLNNNPTPNAIDRLQGQVSNLEAITSVSMGSSQNINSQYRDKLDKATWDMAFQLINDSTAVMLKLPLHLNDDARIYIDNNDYKRFKISAVNGFWLGDSTSQILTSSGNSVYLGGNTLPGLIVLENTNSNYRTSFVVKNQNIPNESGNAVIWHSENTRIASTNGYVDGLDTQVIDLSAGSTDLFYPCLVNSEKFAWECEIHSPSYKSESAFNQNYIKFTLISQGWSDLSPMFTIHNYSFYEEAERTIGSICRGVHAGSNCIYLRGGLIYTAKSNKKITPSLVDVTYGGDEVYAVGHNTSNAGANVNTVWNCTTAYSAKKNTAVFDDSVTFNSPILCYNYGRYKNAATIVFDKHGSYMTGIGSGIDEDTIEFNACDEDGNWINYAQRWRFGGSVIATKFMFSNNVIAINAQYPELASVGNEIIISGSTTMWVNYRQSILNRGIPTEWYWATGSREADATHYAGQFLASGEVAAGSSSDERLKCNFTYPDYAQRLLDMGRVRDYYFNDIAKKRTVRKHDDLQHTGFIYQKVIGVMPEMCEEDTDGYGRLNYIKPKYINTMAGAIQQNTLTIRKTDKRLAIVIREIRRLKRIIKNGKL